MGIIDCMSPTYGLNLPLDGCNLAGDTQTNFEIIAETICNLTVGVNFAVGRCADFLVPNNPTNGELNALFNGNLAVESLVWDACNGVFRFTDSQGFAWTEIPQVVVDREFAFGTIADFVDCDNPTPAELVNLYGGNIAPVSLAIVDCLGSYTIYTTVNSGASWIPIPINTNTNPINSITRFTYNAGQAGGTILRVDQLFPILTGQTFEVFWSGEHEVTGFGFTGDTTITIDYPDGTVRVYTSNTPPFDIDNYGGMDTRTATMDGNARVRVETTVTAASGIFILNAMHVRIVG